MGWNLCNPSSGQREIQIVRTSAIQKQTSWPEGVLSVESGPSLGQKLAPPLVAPTLLLAAARHAHHGRHGRMEAPARPSSSQRRCPIHLLGHATPSPSCLVRVRELPAALRPRPLPPFCIAAEGPNDWPSERNDCAAPNHIEVQDSSFRIQLLHIVNSSTLGNGGLFSRNPGDLEH